MRPELLEVCARYRPSPARRTFQGRAGADPGAGLGSSMDFVDYRDYVPGDDPRHVDWRSYARTDQVKVRLYREEVSPTVEILADLTASMAVTDAKARALRDLVWAYAFCARRDGGRVRIHRCGGPIFDDPETVPFDAPDPHESAADAQFELLPEVPLRPRSVRVVISDFLYPVDPAGMLRRLASTAAQLDVIQLLDPWEANPSFDGPTTLIDCETEARAELAPTREALDDYREKLGRLTEAVASAARGAGARFARVLAAPPESLMRDGLVPAGMWEVGW